MRIDRPPSPFPPLSAARLHAPLSPDAPAPAERSDGHGTRAGASVAREVNATIREARVSQLRTAISAGSYRLDPEATAAALSRAAARGEPR
ncbi:flagellar biosynthesis anti-sigma factor FlgM [Erythrobacteraceae bacterium CFH 75059]|uniref:flagellar biosynthesis anti-sigma factor FlgM n=1 Tax=Qipengyuania thermophila TaxID=2509361 RepID=UPI00101F49A6|nr:flagellar biosynthesis anti-sigma factor FlgM [Qipengyuania thermophila]TCD06293.1 flagellar biosynthesis anti-sigma factor FlgM [Erythrobacteraceae bacterium CFH 75059]